MMARAKGQRHYEYALEQEVARQAARIEDLEAHLRFHQRRLQMDCGTLDFPCPETCLTCTALCGHHDAGKEVE